MANNSEMYLLIRFLTFLTERTLLKLMIKKLFHKILRQKLFLKHIL